MLRKRRNMNFVSWEIPVTNRLEPDPAQIVACRFYANGKEVRPVSSEGVRAKPRLSARD